MQSSPAPLVLNPLVFDDRRSVQHVHMKENGISNSERRQKAKSEGRRNKVKTEVLRRHQFTILLCIHHTLEL